MTNAKISALASATTPLAGTEVLPVVQSSATTQVTVENLTAGRAVNALSYASTTGALFGTTSGNVGIGLSTLSGWGAGRTTLELPTGFSFTRGSVTFGGSIAGNAYYDGTNWKYTATRGAVIYTQSLGGVQHQWFNNASGTANTTLTPTLTMSLAVSGDLTASIGNLVVGTSGKGLTTGSSIPLGFGTNGGTAAMTLNTTGTLSVFQATTAAAPTYVKGAMYFDTTLNKLRIGGATAWETVTSV